MTPATHFSISSRHDKYGNAADRTLNFKDGVLAGWRDIARRGTRRAVDH